MITAVGSPQGELVGDNSAMAITSPFVVALTAEEHAELTAGDAVGAHRAPGSVRAQAVLAAAAGASNAAIAAQLG